MCAQHNELDDSLSRQEVHLFPVLVEEYGLLPLVKPYCKVFVTWSLYGDGGATNESAEVFSGLVHEWRRHKLAVPCETHWARVQDNSYKDLPEGDHTSKSLYLARKQLTLLNGMLYYTTRAVDSG